MNADQHRGVELEIAGRDVVGSVITGRPGRAVAGWLLGLPAAVLVVGVLAVPVVATLVTSLTVAGGHLALDNYAALLADAGTWSVLGNSLVWVLIAVGVSVLGFGLALLTRRVRWGSRPLMIVLAAPVAVSMLVTGVAFRLIYDPSPERGAATAVAVAVHDLVAGQGPAAGARPDGTATGRGGLQRQRADGSLATDPTLAPGEVVDLVLAGVAPDTLPSPAGPVPRADPGAISGRVMASGRAVPGVPVLAQALDQVRGSAVTGADGTFRITVPPSDVLGYALVIPAATVAPPWSGPQWLGPGWIWFALATAFVWAWVGFAAALFRAGLAAVPADLLRMARAEGVGRIGRLRTVVLPLLRPVTAVILLTLVVTAVRLFDLVLVLVPGSMQPSADVVALNWWRDRPFRTPGESAALAMLLFAIVAAVALFGLRGLRHSWPGRPTGVERRDRTRRAPWLGVFAAAVVAVLWAFPLVNLVATAFRTPQDAAVAGWWMSGRDGASLASFAEAAGNGLATALPATAVLAMSATALVLVVAAPAAYLLAWGDLPRWLVRAAVVVLTLFAVVPVQAYAAPLGGVVARLGLAGARTPLILVHGALGVPFAVLLLRAAFAGAPPSLVAEARLGEVGRRAVFEQVLRRARPALVAVAVLEFVQVWNDLAAGLLISGPGATPLTLVLWGQARQFATSAGPVAAGAVLSAVVPVAVLLAAWPTVVRGLTGGARR